MTVATPPLKSLTASSSISLASLLTLLGSGVLVACGGTSGRDGLPQPVEASTLDASLDATKLATEAGLPEGGNSEETEAGDAVAAAGLLLDAGIEYADAARLPDAIAPPPADAGSDSTVPIWQTWPVCATDTVVRPTARPQFFEVPDDAGTCATYAWLPDKSALPPDGGESCDLCTRASRSLCGAGNASAPGFTALNYGVMPPCSDVREAGTAALGPGMGRPLFDLCAELFVCVTQSSCAGTGSSDPNHSSQNCFCGDAGSACIMPGKANGVCKDKVEAAYQLTPSSNLTQLLNGFDDINTTINRPGAEVMALVDCQLNSMCDMCFRNPDGG